MLREKTCLSLVKIFSILALVIIASCDANDLNLTIEESNCTDEEILNILQQCKWIAYAPNDTSVTGLVVDFSNQNIHVFDRNDKIVDEGNWSITSGVIMLNSLSGTMSDYKGEWTITECREEFIEFETDGRVINFERDCTTNGTTNTDTTDVADCTDEEILDILQQCKWIAYAPNDTAVTGLVVDFSNQNIHAFDRNDKIVDEGNWSILSGVIMLNSLSGTMSDYKGAWTITECREEFIEFEADGRFINFERDCTD